MKSNHDEHGNIIFSTFFRTDDIKSLRSDLDEFAKAKSGNSRVISLFALGGRLYVDYVIPVFPRYAPDPKPFFFEIVVDDIEERKAQLRRSGRLYVVTKPVERKSEFAYAGLSRPFQRALVILRY